MKKEYIFIYISFVLLAIVVVTWLFIPKETTELSPGSQPEASALPSVSSQFPELPQLEPLDVPPKMSDLEYLPFSQGGGIDVNSEEVKLSTIEIAKLTPNLPYSRQLVFSNGKEVEILIPGEKLQLNEWTLTVQIFGINYHIETTDPNYQREREAFRQGVRVVFDWMEENGADPKNIIISWGDRAYIQSNAEEWLEK